MNLPNKITTFRMLLIPLIIIVDLIAPLKEIVVFEYLTFNKLIKIMQNFTLVSAKCLIKIEEKIRYLRPKQ